MIHSTAIVSPRTIIGNNISIGPYTIIHDEVQIGDNSVIESHCEIGVPSPLAENQPLVIGAGTLIRSHSIFYAGSRFGDRLVTGHRVTVREKTIAGINFQIGTSGEIQGHCTVGNYVRFQSNVFVGQCSAIGDFVWMSPYVVLTNDPHPPSNVMQGVVVEDFVAIASMSVILPGVVIGFGALVGANSTVNRTVEPGMLVAGVPAKVICRASELTLKDGSGRPAYPWIRHFHRGYPEDVVARWLKEISSVR